MVLTQIKRDDLDCVFPLDGLLIFCGGWKISTNVRFKFRRSTTPKDDRLYSISIIVNLQITLTSWQFPNVPILICNPSILPLVRPALKLHHQSLSNPLGGVAAAATLTELSVDIPRIKLTPSDDFKFTYLDFEVDARNIHQQPVAHDNLVHHLYDERRYSCAGKAACANRRGIGYE